MRLSVFVADQDRGAVGSFHAEKIVEISFVRREDDIEFRIYKAHPREIALEIIVGQQGIRAQAQKFGEGGIVGKRGCFAQSFDGRIEPFAIRHVVGNRFESSALAANDRPRIVQRGLLIGMRRDVAVEFLVRQIGGIKRAARRPRRRSDERRIIH